MIKERRRKEKKKIEILQALYVLTLNFVKCIHQFTKIGHLDVFKIKISEVQRKYFKDTPKLMKHLFRNDAKSFVQF